MMITTTQPESLFSIAEVRKHLRVVSDREDAEIAGFLAAATQYLDGPNGILGICLATRTMRYEMPGLCADETRMPLGPNVQIETFEYSDPTGAAQTIPSTAFYVGKDTHGQFVRFKSSFQIPEVEAERPDAVRITYTAGFGPPSDVPQPLRSAVLILTSSLYNVRETEVTERLFKSSFGVDDLISPYRSVF